MHIIHVSDSSLVIPVGCSIALSYSDGGIAATGCELDATTVGFLTVLVVSVEDLLLLRLAACSVVETLLDSATGLCTT